MHNLPTCFFCPSVMTLSNSGRLTSRSVFLKEKFPIHFLGMKAEKKHNVCPVRIKFSEKYHTGRGSPRSNCQTLSAFAPAVCQYASSSNGGASFAEAVHPFSFNITGLKSPFHKSILKNNPAKCKKSRLTLTKSEG